MVLFPLIATLVSGVFAISLLRQFGARRKPHQLSWAVALGTFAAASASVAIGMAIGWTPGLFRSYYLFGAIVNVPILALGTLYLYLPRKAGHAVAVLVGAASLVGALAVFSAGLHTGALGVSGAIPAGSRVMQPRVRALSRYYSYTGFAVVVAGAVWSAARLARQPGERFRRLAQGNALIALGTVVVAVGSAFARRGQGSVFSIGLAAGVSLMFAGFLRTGPVTGSSPAADRRADRHAR